jgi:hypothetical protein
MPVLLVLSCLGVTFLWHNHGFKKVTGYYLDYTLYRFIWKGFLTRPDANADAVETCLS